MSCVFCRSRTDALSGTTTFGSRRPCGRQPIKKLQIKMVAILGKNWNFFRYTADFSHLISIVLLLYKMISRRSCSGVSLKTNILYLTVFLTRYCNSHYFFPPLYNILFKTFYIWSTTLVIVLMLTKFKAQYDRKHDSFALWIIFLICIPLALFTGRSWQIEEVLWRFSLWIESLAILPQLFLLQRTQRVDVLTKDYIFFLGMYRLFYLLNWARKWFVKQKTEYVAWAAGIVQTIIYLDFIYYYVKALLKGTEMELPR
jgi:ER lumen protein retaining receptor